MIFYIGFEVIIETSDIYKYNLFNIHFNIYIMDMVSK